MEKKIYDVVIVGGGPAGLTAGLYAARAKMSTLIIEKDRAGGQMAGTDEVANYPGAVERVTGPVLASRMKEQCLSFKAEFETAEIQSIQLEENIKVILSKEKKYYAKSVIVAPGSKPRLLNVPGERELTSKGVSYCATCDGEFFTDLEVFVIGGGDSAVEEAIFLTRFAKKVTIVHRRDKLAAAKSIQEKAFKNEKISFLWDTVVREIKGDGIVEGIIFENVKTGEVSEYLADEQDGTFGVFLFVGNLPQTEIFRDLLEMDGNGYIITDENMATGVSGIYAAGDCRVKSLRQVVTAVADGAIAAVQAEKYVENNF